MSQWTVDRFIIFFNESGGGRDKQRNGIEEESLNEYNIHLGGVDSTECLLQGMVQLCLAGLDRVLCEWYWGWLWLERLAHLSHKHQQTCLTIHKLQQTYACFPQWNWGKQNKICICYNYSKSVVLQHKNMSDASCVYGLHRGCSSDNVNLWFVLFNGTVSLSYI